MTPRPYQIEGCDAAVAKFNEGFERVLVVWAVGAGKTVLAAMLAKRFFERYRKPVLFMAHREELLAQAARTFNAFGLDTQLEKAENFAVIHDTGSLFDSVKGAPVVVASMQTMAREKRQSRFPKDYFSLKICDEAHRALSPQYSAAADYFQCPELGITATPMRGDKKNLGARYQECAHEIHIPALVPEYLAKPVLRTVPISIDISAVGVRAGDFSDDALGSAIEPYLPEIAFAINTHARGRKIITFLPLIDTSLKFVECARAEGIDAVHVDGQMSDRREVVAAFREKSSGLISCAALLAEGYDDPAIDTVCVLRPTKSSVLYTQCIGRAMRKAPHKDHALILDFLWHHERQKLIHPAHLIAPDEEVAEKMTALADDRQEHDLGDLLGEASAKVVLERERSLAKQIAANRHKGSKVIDPLQYALDISSVDVSRWEPVFKWHEDAPSEKQLDALAKFGIDTAGVQHKGYASALLDTLFTRVKLNLARPKQLGFLRKHGYSGDVSKVTFQEASAWIDKKVSRWKR